MFSFSVAFIPQFKNLPVSYYYKLPYFYGRSIVLKEDATEGGVLELSDDESEIRAEKKSAKRISEPMFTSQSNQLADGVLKPNLSDPKQTRVILYLIISLVPVIMLIPLMIGSRDFIPPDALPPVSM